jgi:tight adherence protein C
MIDLIMASVLNRSFMVSVFAAIPLLERDEMRGRMKAVALERDKMRARERERMQQGRGNRVSLRTEPKLYMKQTVERLQLNKYLGEDEIRAKLRRAGYRGESPYVAFLFFRLVAPIALFLLAVVYMFAIGNFELPATAKIAVAVFASYLGYKLPELVVQNNIQKRQVSVRRAFPDALDLLLVCVESGMSVETAFRKVAQEIGTQSIPLAEELSLVTAELSYLPDRRTAYENLAERTGLEGVKAVTMALIQAEKYGTSLGSTLRVLAQENRDMRMGEAEKKAAALPPKLTVPMIAFFLPVLFVIILAPAIIQVMAIS